MVDNIHQKEDPALYSVLRSDLFSNLLPEEKQSVISMTGIMKLKKGGLLFSPGKKAEHLYILLTGHIRIFKLADGKGDEEIARFAPGDFIGDFDFARGAKYDAHAQATEDSSVIVFPVLDANMKKFAVTAPNVVSKILLNSAAMVTGRIKSTRKLIIESAYWVQELHRKAYEDPGTGLWKQTFLTDEINRILEDPMALIMLKPDRFKILVDEMGHDAGDAAMIKIAAILKAITRKLNRGWALRFRSNETGILINKCDAAQAASLAFTLYKAIAELPPVPLKNGEFLFSGSIAWGIWPSDNKSWNSLFEGTYQLLMDTWKNEGNKIVQYRQEQPS